MITNLRLRARTQAGAAFAVRERDAADLGEARHPPSRTASLIGYGNLQQGSRYPPPATRNHRADICPGDNGIISGDTSS
jgi:hypothetical protein